MWPNDDRDESIIKGSRVEAILVADIHLSHKPPIARSCEDNWYDVMRYYLDQLRRLSQGINNPLKLGHMIIGNIPIICSGDIFDKWNAPAELINFALVNLPRMLTIAGNHDLPNHSYKERERSAYWTLVEAGKIDDLVASGHQCVSEQLTVYGVEYGGEIPNIQPSNGLNNNLVVIHDYIWTAETGHPNAPEEKRLKRWRQRLQGFDYALFGDNHTTIHSESSTPKIFNPGSLMRRTIDQVDHKPCVGLLMSSGEIKKHYLDCDRDKFLSREELPIRVALEMEELLTEMRCLKETTLDFREAMVRRLDDVDVKKETKRMILEAMDDH